MIMMRLFLLGTPVLLGIPAALAKTAYQELYFNQTLDHFHPEDSRTWPQRYLFSDEFWDGRGALPNGCPGPILLYTGNEGAITGFWEANGFMVEHLAPKWGALLVFPEERFYGASQPFGNASATRASRAYLTTEQVLEDVVALLASLKATLAGAADCPAVAFGGSYGGTLTTFLRAHYPHAVVGGLAASAPIGYYDVDGWAAHGVDAFTWSDIVTRDYADADARCVDAIRAADAALDGYHDPAELAARFHVCSEEDLGPNPSALFACAALLPSARRVSGMKLRPLPVSPPPPSPLLAGTRSSRRRSSTTRTRSARCPRGP